jgi:hypothetical protein
VQLTVATDADVYVLGRALDLDVYEIRIGEGEGQGRWWLHAASHEEGNWIDLAGPHHEGSPPGHERVASKIRSSSSKAGPWRPGMAEAEARADVIPRPETAGLA